MMGTFDGIFTWPVPVPTDDISNCIPSSDMPDHSFNRIFCFVKSLLRARLERKGSRFFLDASFVGLICRVCLVWRPCNMVDGNCFMDAFFVDGDGTWRGRDYPERSDGS